jgi:cysteine rich repeat protein
MHDTESATYRSFVRTLIISGIFLISVYATHTVWGADPNPTPSTAPEPPTAQTPAPPSPSAAPMQEEHGGRMKGGKHKMREACGADIKQFCSNIEPGGGRIEQCLEQHQKEVSQPCNQLLEKHESRKSKRN